MSIFEERPVRTMEESAERHSHIARLCSRRHHYICRRALGWIKRHNPEALAKIEIEARRKFPAIRRRKDRLRIP